MTTTTQNQETQTLEEKITYFEKYDEMRNEITKMCQDLEQNLKKERDELADVIDKTTNPDYFHESSFVPKVDTMLNDLEDTTLKDYANQSIFASIKDKMSEYKEHSMYVAEHPSMSKVDKKTMKEMFSTMKEIEEIEREKVNEMQDRHRKELNALRLPSNNQMISSIELNNNFIKKLNKVDFNRDEIDRMFNKIAYFVNDYEFDSSDVRNSPLVKEDAVIKLKELCKTLDMSYNNVLEPATYVELRK
tara:strand:+ start:32 stop:772 length:741 start_codon:yes stop_codon:yes gene_type:complete